MSKIIIKDFGGGLNQHSAPGLIQNNQSPMMVNCTLAQDGNVAHRLGTPYFGKPSSSTTGNIGLGVYDKSDADPLIFAANDRNLYTVNGSGTFTVVTGGTTLFSASMKPVDFVNYRDCLYFCERGGQLKCWNGTAISDVSGMTNCQFLAVYNGRLIVAEGGVNGRKVWFSNVASDATLTFTVASDFIITSQPVTAVCSLGGSNPVVVFDVDNMYIWDPNTAYVKPIAGFGCISQRCCKVLYGNLIFANKNGLYRYSGSDAYPVKISAPIENDLTLEGILNKANSNVLDDACACAFKNKYYLFLGHLSGIKVAGQSIDYGCIVFDILQQNYSFIALPDGKLAKDVISWIDSSGDEHMIAATLDTSGALFKVNEPNLFVDDDLSDVAQSVTALFRTKHFEFDEGQVACLDAMMKIYNESALTIKYSVNGAVDYKPWTTINASPVGYGWQWVKLRPFKDPIFKTISIEVSGAGKWILDTLILNLQASKVDSNKLY